MSLTSKLRDAAVAALSEQEERQEDESLAVRGERFPLGRLLQQAGHDIGVDRAIVIRENERVDIPIGQRLWPAILVSFAKVVANGRVFLGFGGEQGQTKIDAALDFGGEKGAVVSDFRDEIEDIMDLAGLGALFQRQRGLMH